MDTLEKLLLIDGLNVLRRVYEANPAPDSADKAKRAVANATTTLRRALDEYVPSHALAVFDGPARGWRHDLYAAYRAGRTPMPEQLREAIPSYLLNLDRMGLRHETPHGFEADDTLSAWAKYWSEVTNGAPCVVLSTDKDLCSLLQLPGVVLRDHFGKVWRDTAWLWDKFSVRPDQLLDFLALMGDAVDGVPGVTNVGQKTAAALLREYDTLEGVLAAAGSIKGKLGERLREEADMARLSRQLTRLEDDDLLLSFELEDLRLVRPRQAAAARQAESTVA